MNIIKYHTLLNQIILLHAKLTKINKLRTALNVLAHGGDQNISTGLKQFYRKAVIEKVLLECNKKEKFQ